MTTNRIDINETAIMKIFKNCPTCKKVWQTRDEFLGDPEIELTGYQAHFQELRTGLFLFNHNCRATLAMNLEDFIDLCDGPIFSSHKVAPADCPRYCLNQRELRPCPVECDCHYVRDLIQILKNWSKRPSSESSSYSNLDFDLKA